MYELQPKKLMIINILDILKKYTDENHRLSQKDIIDILKKEYHMSADRKSVRSNLMNLVDFGYHINYSDSIRKAKDGEDKIVLTDWYLTHDFTDSELRLLIDGLLFSDHIPYSQRMELIKKLEGLSSVYFKSKVKHICCAPNSCISNAQLFYTIDILDEAIEKKRKVEFEYCNYDIDKELHPRKNNDGTVRKYIVNPYQMVTMSGRYYLICNYDKYDDISNYRVDRIKNIRILNTSIKPVEKTNGKKFGLNLPEHMSEHVYMFSGDIIQVKFRANSYILNDIIDYFGTSADFSDVTEKDFIVRVRISEEDMFRWAVQFSDHAVVLEPVTLKERIIDALKSALNNYSK
ncbi:helix-turn-helix transcriptional regulator [Ruminococcus flavefaciens]|uniref:Predicted DNA-binding transcriptional regulator YafY, contains an HTH and WYL domains n=1 Tax=Ruminococcus flavefaciens TaxID=1265 RepID=A0A1K1MGL0_RUMFL|nr:WYL domain-containing protein [Ruminococcus flavefaciens]SFW22285.1 Predicted DNA-binding transcriptional regulator YafY, contains an HTH and WYL domains [Ruminococcus flavefaciens]